MHLKAKIKKGIAMAALSMGMIFNVSAGEKPKKPKLTIHQMLGLEQRIDKDSAVKNNTADKYAVIISGDSTKVFEDNLSLAYAILVENGFEKKNTYILNSSTKTECYPADGMASGESIKMVLEHLTKKIDNKDVLFLYITGHGHQHYFIETDGTELKAIPIPAITLPEGELLEPDFARYLQQIKPDIGILVSEQCFGGDFAEHIGMKESYIGISASGPGETAYYHSGNMTSFATGFFDAWRGKDSDVNKDGKTSIKEAYDYAREKDIYTEIGKQVPRMYYQINKIDPDEVFLNKE